MTSAESKDQQHPQNKRDRDTVNQLLQVQGEPDKYNLAELARLKIRYRGFPGARDIQLDLDVILQKWQLTEERLYEITRQLHATGQVYQARGKQQDKEDWN